jgi:hypothetical protein
MVTPLPSSSWSQKLEPPCLLTKLPDEVLIHIVSFATTDVTSGFNTSDFSQHSSQPTLLPWLQRYATAAALCLVSRRFYHLTTPFLYSYFYLDDTMPMLTTIVRNGSSRKIPAISILYRILHQKPHLRALCKGWAVSLTRYQTCNVAKRMAWVGLFANATQFVMGPYRDSYVAFNPVALRKAVLGMPRLRELVLGHWWPANEMRKATDCMVAAGGLRRLRFEWSNTVLSESWRSEAGMEEVELYNMSEVSAAQVLYLDQTAPFPFPKSMR